MGVLGWSPSEFWASTPKDFMAAVRGWREKRGGSPKPGERAPSRERLDEMIAQAREG